MKGKFLAAGGLAAFALVFWSGMQYQKFRYEDACLDMGGGSNPGNHPVCVADPSNHGFWMGPLFIGPGDVENVSYRATAPALAEVHVTLSAGAAQKLHDYTRAHIGQNLRILLDGKVVRDVGIAEAINAGTFVMPGLSHEDAAAIVRALSA